MKFLKFVLAVSFLTLLLGSQTFSQALPAPSNPSPADGGSLYTYDHYLSWNPVSGAKAYQYTIDYDSGNPPSLESDPLCGTIVGTKIIPSKITSSPPVFLTLKCLGNYHWSVRACDDKDCNNTGAWSTSWAFTYIQPTPSSEVGLIPCGRISDHPDTPWNERDACEFKHVFFLIKNILDLILWRIGLIALLFLIIVTGLMFYFSFGSPETLARVKSYLQSTGKAYLLLFLAWLFISLILKILGVTMKWWIITF